MWAFGYFLRVFMPALVAYGRESGRSPARHIFELKLAEAPSGPLIPCDSFNRLPPLCGPAGPLGLQIGLFLQ